MTQAPETLIDTSQAGPELFAAIVGAQSAMQTVGKDGRNNQNGYNYATAEAMIRATRAPLASVGLAVFHAVSFEPIETDPATRGKQWVGGFNRFELILAHSSGDFLRMTSRAPVIVRSSTPEDKAMAASDSYHYGFMLRNLLNMDRAEEGPEAVDRRGDEGYGQDHRGSGPTFRPKPPKATAAPQWGPAKKALSEAATRYRAKLLDLGDAEIEDTELRARVCVAMGIDGWPSQVPSPAFLMEAAQALGGMTARLQIEGDTPEDTRPDETLADVDDLGQEDTEGASE